MWLKWSKHLHEDQELYSEQNVQVTKRAQKNYHDYTNCPDFHKAHVGPAAQLLRHDANVGVGQCIWVLNYFYSLAKQC